MTIFSGCENTNQALLQKELPKEGRLLAIDIGTKRIGIAISDASRFIATPKLIINRQSNLKDFEKIKQLIQDNQVVGIITGLPVNMDGQEHEMTRFARKFTENFDEFLEKKFPIFCCDERLTSAQARDLGASDLSRQKNKRKNKHIDDIAASLILQGFLDGNY